MPQLGKAGAIAGLLVFGTLTSLVAKIVYEVNGPGLDGVERWFRKPWFMTSTPFLGMIWCLPVALLEQKKRRAKAAASRSDNSDATQPLLDGGASNGGHEHTARSELVGSLKLAVPAMFDICATALMNTGLLSVTASVYQMMRGAEMLFAALLAVTVLKRRLNKLHYLGLSACISGIVIVGTASVLSGSGGTQVAVSKAEIVVGMLLIILSQAVQAGQITFEDHFLSTIDDITPMKIVGYEGLYGTLMMSVLLFVVTYLPGKEGAGIHENVFDTAHMLAHSPQIAAWVLTQIAGLLFYNVAGMTVTGLLGAVFRSILETTRTLFVWLVGLILFYTGTGLGEQLDAWSLLQAVGFIVLVAGTVIYGRGDERAAAEYVDSVLAQGEATVEDVPAAQAGAAAVDPNMMDAPAAQPIGMPAPAPAVSGSSPGRSGAMAMPGSSWHNSSTIAANSYQEAVALHLRKRAMSSSNLSQHS